MDKFQFVLQVLPIIWSWGPLILKLIRSIETLFGDAPGAQKKQVALEVLRALLERANRFTAAQIDILLSAFGHFINAFVDILHFRGELQHKPEVPKQEIAITKAAVEVSRHVNDKRMNELEALLAR